MDVRRTVKDLLTNNTECYLLICRIPGNQWALEMAKFNLVNNYLLVGVTEHMGDFIAVIEALLPRFFSGALDLYNSGKAHFVFTKLVPYKNEIYTCLL